MLPIESPAENNVVLTEAIPAALATEGTSAVAERMDILRWLIGVMMIGQACEMRASALEIYQSVVNLTEDVDSLKIGRAHV